MSEEPRRIDLERWPRRRHHELFSACAYPHFNLCIDVDVAPLVRAAKAKGSSFTAHLTYPMARAADAVPEPRYRIRGDGIVEHTVVHPATTVLCDDFLHVTAIPWIDDVGQWADGTE